MREAQHHRGDTYATHPPGDLPAASTDDRVLRSEIKASTTLCLKPDVEIPITIKESEGEEKKAGRLRVSWSQVGGATVFSNGADRGKKN